MPFIYLFFLSFDQLKIAASNLKKQSAKKNEGSLAYVKGGLSTFFEAQDALAGQSLLCHCLICPTSDPLAFINKFTLLIN